MPDIQIPSAVITGLQLILAFTGAFLIALWISMIIWTFKDVRSRSRDVFAILLATLMVVIFGPLGLLLYFLLRPKYTLAEQYERALEEEALLQDLEERPRCPGCSRQVNEAWIVCPDCHTTLKKICPNCEHSLHLQWHICPFCGTRVSAAPVRYDDYHDHSGEPVGQQTRPTSVPLVSVEGEIVSTPATTRSDETRPFRQTGGPSNLNSIQKLADRVTEFVRPALDSLNKYTGQQ